VLLVLLVPCTDWFITFTHLAGGDTRLAIAFSPASLLLQIILLPVYLWAFLGEDLVVTLTHGETLSAFTGLIVLPLFAAYMTEKWVERGDSRSNLLNRLAWFPVPLLAIVVFSIAATQVSLIMATSFILGWLLLIFVVFLIIAGWIARLLASWFALLPVQGRALAFSLGTRNSFVVLPLALALPSPYELTVVVIVFQSLVELLGMIVYLWVVPKWLFPLSF
jgi:arsenite transporter